MVESAKNFEGGTIKNKSRSHGAKTKKFDLPTLGAEAAESTPIFRRLFKKGNWGTNDSIGVTRGHKIDTYNLFKREISKFR